MEKMSCATFAIQMSRLAKLKKLMRKSAAQIKHVLPASVSAKLADIAVEIYKKLPFENPFCSCRIICACHT